MSAKLKKVHGGLFCIRDRVNYNNPKGNADIDKAIRTIKEDFGWIKESHSPFEFIEYF